MNEKELFELSKEAAQELSYEWAIGNFSRFCDEPADFDSAPVEEIANRLLPFFRKVLTAPKPSATVGLT